MPRTEFVVRDHDWIARRSGTCKHCGQEIWWVRNPARPGKSVWQPENADGQAHRETCPSAHAVLERKGGRLF